MLIPKRIRKVGQRDLRLGRGNDEPNAHLEYWLLFSSWPRFNQSIPCWNSIGVGVEEKDKTNPQGRFFCLPILPDPGQLNAIVTKLDIFFSPSLSANDSFGPCARVCCSFAKADGSHQRCSFIRQSHVPLLLVSARFMFTPHFNRSTPCSFF